MARPQKKGIDYFSFDVGFFDDRKIRELRGKFGSDGITVYIYLLCLIYKENGYYAELDDGFDYVASADLNMDSEKIGQIINFLCKRSLFNDTLFTSDKVLTSHGIQMRFQEAVKTRASKKEILVNRFWLLDEHETQSYIRRTDFQGLSEENDSYSEKNDSLSMEKPLKKSKVKKSKEKKSKAEESNMPSAVVPQNLINFYQKNISRNYLTPRELDNIQFWLDKVDADVILWAMEQAVDHKARNWKYIEAILTNHFNAGRTTIEAVKDGQHKYKTGRFTDLDCMKDSDFNYEELEKIMLEKSMQEKGFEEQ